MTSVILPSSEVSSLSSLLQVISDPRAAKARMDAMKQESDALAKREAELAVKLKRADEIATREKAVEAREVDLRIREAHLKAALLDLERREAIIKKIAADLEGLAAA
jgi:hypothetical protein